MHCEGHKQQKQIGNTKSRKPNHTPSPETWLPTMRMQHTGSRKQYIDMWEQTAVNVSLLQQLTKYNGKHKQTAGDPHKQDQILMS